MTPRFIFYCDQKTFDDFEAFVKAQHRFIDPKIPEHHMLVPLPTLGFDNWPVLKVKEDL